MDRHGLTSDSSDYECIVSNTLTVFEENVVNRFRFLFAENIEIHITIFYSSLWINPHYLCVVNDV